MGPRPVPIPKWILLKIHTVHCLVIIIISCKFEVNLLRIDRDMTGQWRWKIKNKNNTQEEEKTERKQKGFPTKVGNLNNNKKQNKNRKVFRLCRQTLTKIRQGIKEMNHLSDLLNVHVEMRLNIMYWTILLTDISFTQNSNKTLHKNVMILRNTVLCFEREKGRDLTQSYDKSPYTIRNVKRVKWQHKQRHKKVRLNSGCGPT